MSVPAFQPTPPPTPAAAPQPAAGGAAPPPLAVVIPCFNQGDTLAEAIASVQALGVPHELVIVNDGSDDPATLAALQQLRAEGFRVLDQANAGVAAARNAGVAATRAPVVLPLDADNVLEPGFVGQALEALAAEPQVGVVYGDRREFGLREGVVRVAPFDLPRLLAYNYIDACALVRRQAWEAAGGHDTTAPVQGWEDWEFWISVAQAGWEFRHLAVPGFGYRVREGSMLAATERDDVRRRLYDHVIARHEAFYREHLTPVLTVAQRVAGDLSHRAREADALHGEVARLHGELRALQAELAGLHGHVASRDEEVRQLHAEVAIRDEEVRRLHTEITAHDEQLAALRAQPADGGGAR